LQEQGEGQQPEAVVNGTSEAQIRNQYRAWLKYMTQEGAA
jgi:hypothetical protein